MAGGRGASQRFLSGHAPLLTLPFRSSLTSIRSLRVSFTLFFTHLLSRGLSATSKSVISGRALRRRRLTEIVVVAAAILLVACSWLLLILWHHLLVLLLLAHP